MERKTIVVILKQVWSEPEEGVGVDVYIVDSAEFQKLMKILHWLEANVADPENLADTIPHYRLVSASSLVLPHGYKTITEIRGFSHAVKDIMVNSRYEEDASFYNNKEFPYANTVMEH